LSVRPDLCSDRQPEGLSSNALSVSDRRPASY
jgi:hypothetical protein